MPRFALGGDQGTRQPPSKENEAPERVQNLVFEPCAADFVDGQRRSRQTRGGAPPFGSPSSKAGPLTGEELERAMPKKEVQASEELTGKLKALFTKMDFDGDGSVTKEEAIKFWGKNFAKVNAQSMFNEVDEDGDGSVTWDEFFAFWKNVLGSGYSEEDLIEEVDMMMEGGAWVDFDDGRTT